MYLLLRSILISSLLLFGKISFTQKINESDSLVLVEMNQKQFSYYKQDKIDSAITLAKITVQKSKKIFGEFSIYYAVSLNNLAFFYEKSHNYTDAELIYIKVIQVYKKILGENQTERYINSLNNLAFFYQNFGNLEDAEPLLKEVIFVLSKVMGKNNSNYATSLNNLADLYQSMGIYNESEQLYRKAQSIYKLSSGENDPSYAISKSNLGNLYIKMGKYLGAEKLLKESSIIFENAYGVNHPYYATILNILGGLYHIIGNYKSANFFLAQSLDIRKKVLGTDHPDYARSLNNLASLYQDLDDYAAADTLYKEALAIRKKLLGKDHPDYANSLNNLADLYENMGKYVNAEILQKEALSIRKKILGIKHPDYALSLNNLAGLYSSIGNFKESETLYKEALTIRKILIGTEHPDYAVSINNLTINYYDNKQFNPWQQIVNTSIQTENNNQKLLLKNYSETEKETYLKVKIFYHNIYSSMLHYFKHQSTNSFYQSTTSKQGWLLQGKQQLTQLANQSKDSSVKSLFTQWQNTNRQYAQAIQLTIEKRKLNNINVDSLQEQSVQLEKQLIAAIPSLQAVITNTGFTGKEVAAKLKPKEAVVHWVSFQYKSPQKWTDSVLYAAYIITANDTSPKFVTVFEEKQLQQILKSYHASANARSTIKKDSSTNTNADIALHNLIWKPLLPYLQNATTIYNLPAGLLHKISFAALTDSSNKSLIDSYELHQLLSINELVNPLKIANNKNTIALFGGANYNAVNATTATNASTTQPPLYRNATSNTNIQFNYLQGTKTEVETVATNAKNTNWKTQSYTGTSATEEYFKNIGGENAPKILHVATHGFYFPPTKTKPNNFINDDKNVPRDFPLLRSGLVLSGVNNYWGKDTLLENQEDGIVTAQEISNLNLLNTDLVVLSACQTALGDINGSEGVYGLQRAFKMAGVKKLLMSLWEVPDAETAELMQLFYSNVFKGETYYTAFRKAQLTLKAKYKDPTKWAGFVLVGE